MEPEGREVAGPAVGLAYRAIVRTLAPPAERADILADLADEAAAIEGAEGRRAARRFVRWQIAHSTVPWIRRRARECADNTWRHAAMLRYGLITDIRLAARRLWMARGFTALAIATLAIGIAAVSTAFSLAYGLWLKPLPYSDPDHLVWIHARHVPSGSSAPLTPLELAEYQSGSSSLAEVAGFHYGAGVGHIDGEPVRLVNHFVSPNLFRVLGVRPVLGRDLSDADVGTSTVMLSHEAWTTYFGRDPAILSRGLSMNGARFAIAGVMPAGFFFPRGLEADMWTPAHLSRADHGRRQTQAVARLAPGRTIEAASAEADARGRRLAEAHPATNADWTQFVAPAGVTASASSQLAFKALLGIVALFLLIACANLAGLMLARNATRRSEIAVCLSLGATRWRMSRALLIESALLAAAGAAVGILLAAYGVRAVTEIMPPTTSGLDGVTLNVPVVALAVSVATICAFLVGLVPAWSLRSLRPSDALAGSRTVARGTARAQRALVIAEVVLAVVLIAGAAAMLRSLSAAVGQDRGYDPHGLQALNVMLPFANDEYPSTTIRARVFDQMLDRVRSVPGVRQAAATTGFPGSRLGILGSSTLTTAPGATPVLAAVHAATPGFFETMDIPLTAGRVFTDADSESAPRVAIINQQLADQFPGGSPLGQRVPLEIFGEIEHFEIVGVTGNIRLTDYIGNRVIVPLAQKSPYWIDLVFRADTGAAALTAARRSLREMNAAFLIENESSFQTIIANSLALERTQSLFAATIGGLAVTVAGVGLYSLLTFMAAQRRRELGIRLALGSQPTQLFRDVLMGALRLAGAGLAVGVLAAMALVRVLSSRVFGLTSVDASVYAMAAALVLFVALAAAWVPARRVMRTDPLIAMRGD